MDEHLTIEVYKGIENKVADEDRKFHQNNCQLPIG
jgi:hypothetical protein